MEIEQQDPLVTYRRPRLLPGEQVLTFLMYAFVVIFGAAALVIGFLVVVIWGNFLDGTVGTASYRNTVGNIVFVLTIVAMASVVIAFLLVWYFLIRV